MKKTLILACILIISCTSGCAFFPESTYKELDPPSVVDAVHLQYNTAKAELRTLSDIKEFTGTFVYSYYKCYTISQLQTEGLPSSFDLFVSDGQTVEENALLMQFNTTAIDETIAHAKVNVAQFQQNLNNIADKSSDEYAVAKAILEEAQAVLSSAEEKRQQYFIHAPFSGKIRLNYTSAANEAENAVKEVIVYRDDGICLAINAEDFTQTLKEGESGTVTKLDGASVTDITGTGTVRKAPVFLGDGYSENDKYYYIDVTGDFSCDDTAVFTVILDTHENVICVPARALKQYKSNEYYLRLLSSDGITRTEVIVEVGIINSDYAEIISGISVGDTVILG